MKQKILLVAANVVKSQVLNKVAWAANLIKLLPIVQCFAQMANVIKF